MGLLQIVLCILLPPLAVARTKGLGGAFLLNIILCILGWIPGVIHALLVSGRPSGV